MLRLGQQRRGKITDLVGYRCREQQGLSLGGDHRYDLADRCDETHVQHAVSFVKHQRLDPIKMQQALLDQVKQTSGRCNNDVDAATDRIGLRPMADAAEDRHMTEAYILAVGRKALGDLHGKLTRGRKNECTWSTTLLGSSNAV